MSTLKIWTVVTTFQTVGKLWLSPVRNIEETHRHEVNLDEAKQEIQAPLPLSGVSSPRRLMTLDLIKNTKYARSGSRERTSK